MFKRDRVPLFWVTTLITFEVNLGNLVTIMKNERGDDITRQEGNLVTPTFLKKTWPKC
jgi:hypothetical protein